jgi:GTP cyclohydrolase I
MSAKEEITDVIADAKNGIGWPSMLPRSEMEKAYDEVDALNAVRTIIHHIGDNPTREGLKETPYRVIRAYRELFSGYHFAPADIGKLLATTFMDGKCDEMVVVKDIQFYSTCEHHMLPFQGVAHIGYVPNDRIVGLSKLPRLLEVFARRLQVQERLTQQVTESLDIHLQPKGSACVIEAQHLCMACRGVQKQTAVMVTSSLTGVFRKPEVRAEFLQLAKG